MYEQVRSVAQVQMHVSTGVKEGGSDKTSSSFPRLGSPEVIPTLARPFSCIDDNVEVGRRGRNPVVRSGVQV